MRTNRVSDFFVGGDRLFSDFFDNLNVDAFPRFNVTYDENKKYRIEMALPGWHKDSVKVRFDAGVLTVEGAKQEVGEVQYLHRGISGKSFKRSFIVPRTLEVAEASLVDGILVVAFNTKVEDSTKLITVQ